MSAKDYWDRHASHYDESVRWLLGKPMPPMLELVSESVRGRKRVMEVAAGTGIVTEAMAKACKSVVATDYSSAMVSQLEQRVRNAKLLNVTCEQADIYALPFGAGEFDAVVAANVLHLLPDGPKAIGAMKKVLALDGIVVVPTYCHDETPLSSVVSRLLALTGFPGCRRFTLSSLRKTLVDNGIQITNEVRLDGVLPIGFVAGSFFP